MAAVEEEQRPSNANSGAPPAETDDADDSNASRDAPISVAHAALAVALLYMRALRSSWVHVAMVAWHFVHFDKREIVIAKMRIHGWYLRIGDALVHGMPAAMVLWYYGSRFGYGRRPVAGDAAAADSSLAAVRDGAYQMLQFARDDIAALANGPQDFRTVAQTVANAFSPSDGAHAGAQGSGTTYRETIVAAVHRSSSWWAFPVYVLYRCFLFYGLRIDVVKQYGVNVPMIWVFFWISWIPIAWALDSQL